MADEAQLAVAGVAVMLAVQQSLVWRWEGRRSPARWVVIAAAATSALLVANVLTLAALASSRLGVMMGLRDVCLTAVELSALGLAVSVSGRRAELVPVALTAAAILGRLVLWLGTPLVYTHTARDGLPRYGPLLEPTSLLVVLVILAWFAWAVSSGGRSRDRWILAGSVAGTIVLALCSLYLPSPIDDELLTGYLLLPFLAGLLGVLWLREVHAQRALPRLLAGQSALPELSELAVSAPRHDLDVGARAALQLRGGTAGDSHARAVHGVVDAAPDGRRALDELERRAERDQLTGLPSRAGILQILTGALRPEADVTVVLCSLDGLATVNNAYGHAVGDEVLRLAGQQLHGALLPCDVIGRFGSDEFVVVCRDASGGDDPDRLAWRLHEAVRVPVSSATISVRVGVTLGVVHGGGRDGPRHGERLLREAMTAMHDAKQRKVPTGWFNEELYLAAMRRARIAERLTSALARDEIFVEYQPIVELATWRVVGLHALPRWKWGRRSVPPREWTSVAESTGLVCDVGERVLQLAVAQARSWREAGTPVTVGVSVSTRQLVAPGLEQVGRALSDVGPGSLSLAVSAAAAPSDDVVAAIRLLNRRGVRIALDEFSSGGSWLAEVAELPVDELRIDPAITAHVRQPVGTAPLVAALGMARALSLDVVATGVETAEQHAALAALGYPRAQGWYYGPPVDAAGASTLLRRGAVARPPGA